MDTELRYLISDGCRERNERPKSRLGIIDSPVAPEVWDIQRPGRQTLALYNIIQFIPRYECIITIEDAAELLSTQPNSACLIADRNSKYQSPDELFVSTATAAL